MLVELRVRELGVIEDLDIVFGAGLTVITGETGAGKTLVVEALELLVGGRADADASCATGPTRRLVEGRFVEDDDELVVLALGAPRRAARAPDVDGKMVPVAALEEVGRDLVDLYGQHAHQSLLRPAAAAQRRSTASPGSTSNRCAASEARSPSSTARSAPLGGDTRQRERELDLLALRARRDRRRARSTAPTRTSASRPRRSALRRRRAP